MHSPNYFDIFQGTNKQWYWNLHNGGNHAIIATGGEGFVSFDNAIRAAKNFREDVATADIPTREEVVSMAQDDILDEVEPDRTDQEDTSESDEEPEEPTIRDADNG